MEKASGEARAGPSATRTKAITLTIRNVVLANSSGLVATLSKESTRMTSEMDMAKCIGQMALVIKASG
jgi:hypothetical protein